MTQRSDGAILTGLVLLSAIPAIAGSARLVEIGRGGPLTPENARFLTAPLPAVLHIVSVIVFCLLGAWQFAPRFRAKHLPLHRWLGRYVFFPAGLLAALTGLWLTQFYPPVDFDGPVLYVIRLTVGCAMTAFLLLGFWAALKRDLVHHRAWMMRGYALGLGAGTQVFTHLPLLLMPAAMGQGTRAAAMGAGWLINLCVAEYWIRRS